MKRVAIGILAVVGLMILIVTIGRLGGLLPFEKLQSENTRPPSNVTTVVQGLEIPWEVAFAPDGRIFITERSGRVRIVKDNQLLEQPALTIEVPGQGEGGLQGFALDPKFSTNRYVYLYVSYQADGIRNRVVRYREDNNRLIDPTTLLDNIPGNTNHNGGRLAFGPDNKLYVTTGDSQQPSTAQDKNSLAGKILRLNSDGSAPVDNPFFVTEQIADRQSAARYIWSFGHRNPQGLAWTKQGELYATEHGPSGDLGLCCRDEVNKIERGGNYGWPLITGSKQEEGFLSPFMQSGTTDTWAPAGAAFGSDGHLYFGALRGQHLRRILPDGSNETKLFAGQFGRIRAVTLGPDGALYFTTSNRDGRGKVRDGDDQLLRYKVE